MQSTNNKNMTLSDTFFELTPYPLLAINFDGKIVNLNSAYIATFGLERLIAKNVIQHDLSVLEPVINPKLFDIYQSMIRDKSDNNYDLSLEIELGEINSQFVIKRLLICVANETVGIFFIHENHTEIVSLKTSLRKKNRQLNELQEVAGLGSWELDLSSGKADWTRKEYLLLGYDEGEVETIPDNFLNRIHKDDKERALKELARPFEDDTACYETEFRLVMPDGHIRYVAESGQIIKDKNNKPLRFVGTTLDITRRKAAEEELKNHRDHLKDLVFERTKELEAFSHSLAHDLRAPLRRVSGLCSVLKEDYFSELDDVGKDYIKRIIAATKFMDDMVQGMLRIARVSEHKLKIEPINLSKMVLNIINDLIGNFPENKVEVDIQVNIIANSDRNMLFVALHNLIENALKYSSNQTVSRITFGSHGDVSDGLQAYFIRDNGVGFDMKYADKLFSMFKRLHGESEFEGIGIGLSTVNKAFSRLNGRVWAESEPGKGAIFYFSF